MKKLLLLLIIPFLSFGQESIHSKQNISILGGINVSRFHNYEVLNGGQFGVRYNLNIGNINIHPELNYMNLKWENITFSEPVVKYNLHYISFPILVKLKLSKINMLFGPQASYLIGGKIGAMEIGSEVPFVDSEGVLIGEGQPLERFDTSILCAFEIDLKTSFFMSLRGLISLTRLQNQQFIDVMYLSNNLHKKRWASIQISIGYRL